MNQRFLKTFSLSTLLLGSVISLIGCSKKDDATETIIQTMKGEGELNGEKVHFDLNFLKEDSEFYIEDSNKKYERLWGDWEFKEGKGYILTFDDAYWTVKKTLYSEEKKQFRFRYEVNLGSSIGKTTVNFTGDATGFQYDGIGWGFIPYQFVGSGKVGDGSFGQMDGKLTCKEDLSCDLSVDFSMIPIPSCSGTYTFDDKNHQYTFSFPVCQTIDGTDDPKVINSTYDATSNSYTIKIDVAKKMTYMPTKLTLVYQPE